jgi:hypothetical protein
MTDYDVGFGKPPKHSQFQKGNNANPNGRRGKHKPPAIADVINSVFDGVAEYRDRGRAKKALRRELTIKTHVSRALKGDLKSIETLLMLRTQAQASGDSGVQRFEITDWMPDYPGQTGEQKTREFAAQAKGEAPAWWETAHAKSKDGDK